MSKALSVDLRVRVLAAVSEGATHRQAAARFGVSAASVSRWRALKREQDDAVPDTTVEELRQALGARDHWFGYGTLQRFFRRHRITRKKRPPMLRSRIVQTF